MRDISIAEDIVPVGEFRARSGQMLERLKTSGRPLVITQNGRPAGVLITPEEFDRMRNQLEVAREIEEGLADLDAGRTMTTRELLASLRASAGT